MSEEKKTPDKKGEGPIPPPRTSPAVPLPIPIRPLQSAVLDTAIRDLSVPPTVNVNDLRSIITVLRDRQRSSELVLVEMYSWIREATAELNNYRTQIVMNKNRSEGIMKDAMVNQQSSQVSPRNLESEVEGKTL